MAHRHKMHARAKGGRTSFVDAPTEKEAGSKKDTFKHGGHTGLHGHGHKAKHRADRRARGGGVHSPFSHAAKGNDEKRRPGDKDHHQPRAAGGAVNGFARGGRPSPFSRAHSYNFGAHDGAGHEEPTMEHPPVHEKHGGKVAHHRGMGKHHHHAGHGGHLAHHPHHDGKHPAPKGHGAHHKAKGRKHRADGGKVCDKEED